MTRLHYSGPLAWTNALGDRTLIKGGSAACGSAVRNLTKNPERVDCGHCLRCMRLAGVIDAKPKVPSELDRLRAENARLRSALEWFADEGHYAGTYRHGAGYAEALGVGYATAELAGKWCVRHRIPIYGKECGSCELRAEGSGS